MDETEVQKGDDGLGRRQNKSTISVLVLHCGCVSVDFELLTNSHVLEKLVV